jgi:hypothetical protein
MCVRGHGFSFELSREGKESYQFDFNGQGDLYMPVRLWADHRCAGLTNCGCPGCWEVQRLSSEIGLEARDRQANIGWMTPPGMILLFLNGT